MAKYWFPLGAWTAVLLAFAVVSLPETYQPPALNVDKVRHAAAYALFGALAARALWGATGRGVPFSWVGATLGVIALGLGTETIQAFVPGRAADVVDLAADIIGGTAGAGFFLWAFTRDAERYP